MAGTQSFDAALAEALSFLSEPFILLLMEAID